MKSRFALVLVTVPNRKTARALARDILEARLAACVNLIPALESHYWWQGNLESSTELLLFIKTTRALLRPLEKLVLACHPYDTPEFLVFDIDGGNRRYCRWISDNVRQRK